jgi:chromosome segregation ATPase
MCKKLVLAAVAIVVGSMVVKHTSVGSLARVWWNDARQAVERQVPPETQIKRLEQEVNKIDADIKQNLSRLAQQEVETQKLDEDIASAKDSQAALKTEITALTKGLEANTQPVKFDTRVARNTRKLDLQVATYNRRKAELKSKESLLSMKREALEAAHARINEMFNQKEELHVTVEELKAKLAIARSNAIKNNASIELDDSQVARCKELANAINDQLAVAVKEADLKARYGYTNAIPKVVDEAKSTTEVLKSAKKALEEDGEQRIVTKDNN